MALCILVSLLLVAFLAYSAPPLVTMAVGRDDGLARLGKQWNLGNSVDKVVSALFTVFAGLVAVTLWCWWKYQSARAGERPNASRGTSPAPRQTAHRENAMPAELASTLDATPQLSKAALWGALMVPLFLLAVICFALSMVTFVTPVARYESGGQATVARPMWIGMIVLIPLAVIQLFGFLSPFLTTILGVVAISNIRHSRGKLYGLPLAVFDALLFPLMLLDLVLFGVGGLLLSLALRLVLSPTNDAIVIAPLLITTLLLLPLIVVLDIWLVRLTWQAVTKDMPGSEPSLPPGKGHAGKEPQFQPQRTGGGIGVGAIILILMAVGVIPLVLCGGVLGAFYFSAHRSAPRMLEATPYSESHEHDSGDSHGHMEGTTGPVVSESTRLK
jgi:hypothetical protein